MFRCNAGDHNNEINEDIRTFFRGKIIIRKMNNNYNSKIDSYKFKKTLFVIIMTITVVIF